MGKKRQRQRQRDRRMVYQRRMHWPDALTCPGRSAKDDCDDFPLTPCSNCRDRWIADGDWNPGREWRPIEIAPEYEDVIPDPQPARPAIVPTPEVA